MERCHRALIKCCNCSIHDSLLPEYFIDDILDWVNALSNLSNLYCMVGWYWNAGKVSTWADNMLRVTCSVGKNNNKPLLLHSKIMSILKLNFCRKYHISKRSLNWTLNTFFSQITEGLCRGQEHKAEHLGKWICSLCGPCLCFHCGWIKQNKTRDNNTQHQTYFLSMMTGLLFQDARSEN